MKKTWILLFLIAFLAVAVSPGLPEKPGLIRAVYADPQNPPKTPETGKTIPESGLGTQEIPRSDGGNDKVYYSVTTPDEERKRREEEREKADKSYDVLKNVIIDRRPR